MPNVNVSSPEDVANQALAAIGHTLFITSLGGQDPTSTTCNRLLGQARDEVLRAFAWPFAIRHARLPLLDPVVLAAGAVPQGWRFALKLPTDVIRLHGIYRYSGIIASADSSDTTAIEAGNVPSRHNLDGYRIWHRNPSVYQQVRYVRETDANVGQIILTDCNEPILEYTGTSTDVTQWDPDFVRSVSMLLGSYLAGPLKKDTALAGQLLAAYHDAISEAVSNADMEMQRDPDPLPTYMRARRYGGWTVK